MNKTKRPHPNVFSSDTTLNCYAFECFHNFHYNHMRIHSDLFTRAKAISAASRMMDDQETISMQASIQSAMNTLVGTLSLAVLFGTAPVIADEIAAVNLMQGFPPKNVVNTKNWRTPPYHRWAFQHVEMISPTATISRGHQEYVELKAAENSDLMAYKKLSMANGLSVAEYIDQNNVDGVLVLKNGKIVAEHYANQQDIDTRHIMFSVGKSFTGIMAETLVHERVLDDSQLVSHYIPELAKSGYGDATVRQVMDMLVDLEFSEDYSDPYSDISQFIYAGGLGDAPKGVKVYPSLYAYLPSVQKGGEHGEHWEYVSATTETLGWIMNRASKQSWTELFEQKIYQHIQPRRDATIIVDASGKEIAAGGMSMTLRDVGRFAYLVSNDGRFAGEQVIPSAVIQTIKAGGDPDKFPTIRLGSHVSYKSQWYKDITAGILGGFGIHGQAIQIGLDNGIIIVTQSSWPVAGSPALWARRTAYQEAVFAALDPSE